MARCRDARHAPRPASDSLTSRIFVMAARPELRFSRPSASAPSSGRARTRARSRHAHTYFLLLVGVVTLASACDRSKATLDFPHVAANGRPATCPDAPANSDRGIPGFAPDSARCSYADHGHGNMTVIEGNVIGESPDDRLGVGLADVIVGVHPHKAGARVDKLKGASVTTRTDEHGYFRTQALLPPGDYLLVVTDPATGEALSFRPVEIITGTTGRIRVEALIVPLGGLGGAGKQAAAAAPVAPAPVGGQAAVGDASEEGNPGESATAGEQPPNDGTKASGAAKSIDLRSRPGQRGSGEDRPSPKLPPTPLLPAGLRGRESPPAQDPGSVEPKSEAPDATP